MPQRQAVNWKRKREYDKKEREKELLPRQEAKACTDGKRVMFRGNSGETSSFQILLRPK